MSLSPFVVWLLLTGILVVAELVTGTFYLLVLGACTALAVLAAAVGVPVIGQLFVFSITAALCVFGKVPRKLQAWLAKAPEVLASDIGATVTVTEITAPTQFRVSYRGTQWPARLLSAADLVSVGQSLRVVRVEGIELICKRAD